MHDAPVILILAKPFMSRTTESAYLLAATGAVQQIIVASSMLMVAVVVLFLAAWYYRKRFLSDDTASGAPTWTFQDLREMRDRGELTEQEYEALRASLISSFHHSGETHRPLGGTHTVDPEPRNNFDLEKDQDS